MTGSTTQPQLSAILYAADSFTTISKTLRHLHAQTARDRLELVLVAPAAVQQQADLIDARRVEVPVGAPAHVARAAGVRAATAPVVVLTEDHSFPEPGWAAALIAAHRGPWAAVGPVVSNANPGSLLSWVSLFINYGQWAAPHPGGVVRDLPGHNSSYKRALLLAYDLQLEEMLERESLLHETLQANGHQLYLEPAAQTNHVNVPRGWSTILDQYLGGRCFAGTRAATGRWNSGPRLRACLATPVMIAGWLRAILRDIRRCGLWPQLWPRILPALVFSLGARGLGEIVGYLRGPGDTTAALADFEFHRDKHLCARDQLAMAKS